MNKLLKTKQLSLIVLLFFTLNANAQAWQSKVIPSVFEALQRQSTTEILVVMREQGDLSMVNSQATKEEKGEKVVNILRGVAEHSQVDIKQFLTTQNVDFQAFWLVNALHLTAPPDTPPRRR